MASRVRECRAVVPPSCLWSWPTECRRPRSANLIWMVYRHLRGVQVLPRWCSSNRPGETHAHYGWTWAEWGAVSRGGVAVGADSSSSLHQCHLPATRFVLLVDQTDLGFQLGTASHSARCVYPRLSVDLPDESPHYASNRDLNARELPSCQGLVHNERPIRVKCLSTLVLYLSTSRSSSRNGRA